MFGPFRDGFAQLLLGGFAESGQLGHAPGLAGFLQLLDGADLKLLVERLDLLGAQPRDGKQFENSRRKIRAQFLEVFERSGGGQLFDLARDGLADSRHFQQGLFVL